MFHTRLALLKDINVILSKIIKLNRKLANLEREHKHDNKSLPRGKTSAIG